MLKNKLSVAIVVAAAAASALVFNSSVRGVETLKLPDSSKLVDRLPISNLVLVSTSIENIDVAQRSDFDKRLTVITKTSVR